MIPSPKGTLAAATDSAVPQIRFSFLRKPDSLGQGCTSFKLSSLTCRDMSLALSPDLPRCQHFLYELLSAAQNPPRCLTHPSKGTDLGFNSKNCTIDKDADGGELYFSLKLVTAFALGFSLQQSSGGGGGLPFGKASSASFLCLLSSAFHQHLYDH